MTFDADLIHPIVIEPTPANTFIILLVSCVISHIASQAQCGMIACSTCVITFETDCFVDIYANGLVITFLANTQPAVLVHDPVGTFRTLLTGQAVETRFTSVVALSTNRFIPVKVPYRT